MAKGGEVEGSLILSLFSTVAFRRKLLDAIICGGCGVSRHHRSEFESKTGERSSRLADLLKEEEISTELEKDKNRKLQFLEELQSAVSKLLQLDNDLKRLEGAMEVRRLAKGNAEARETLEMLGAIPPLIGLIDSDDSDLQIESLYALLNLGIGNDMNKAAIMKAGAVHKMLDLIKSGCSHTLSEAIVANFLGLSALDSNKTIIGASNAAITFLVDTFRNAKAKSQIRLDSLRSLFNLSILPSNIPKLVEADLIPSLFGAIEDMEMSEKVLSLLSNLVGSPEGRISLSRLREEAIPVLVDVLHWCDSPGCQEKATYILMIMAYKGCKDRAAMMEAGIVSSLLELTLMGSALAQKRASRLLEILRVDKGKHITEAFTSSAPLCWGPQELGEEDEESEGGGGLSISQERKAVNELVQQSLQHNMTRIVKRANLGLNFVPSSDRLTAMTGSSATSKSLPF